MVNTIDRMQVLETYWRIKMRQYHPSGDPFGATSTGPQITRCEPTPLPELRPADRGVASSLESMISGNTRRVYGTQGRLFDKCALPQIECYRKSGGLRVVGGMSWTAKQALLASIQERYRESSWKMTKSVAGRSATPGLSDEFGADPLRNTVSGPRKDLPADFGIEAGGKIPEGSRLRNPAYASHTQHQQPPATAHHHPPCRPTIPAGSDG